MEKKKSHYSLATIKSLISEGKWVPTKTAIQNAYTEFGYNIDDIRNHILNLNTNEFYKSMTSNHDQKIWQDVYRSSVRGTGAYIKIQVLQDMSIVISFKKR